MIDSRSNPNNSIHVRESGEIDHDYTGEIEVLLFNLSDMPYYVKKHERIAQLIIAKKKISNLTFLLRCKLKPSYIVG